MIVNFNEEEAIITYDGLQIVIQENKAIEERIRNKFVSKDKIKAKIEDLEKEQEDNRKKLYDAVNNLNFKEIDKISDRISVNMSVRGILQSLLEEE